MKVGTASQSSEVELLHPAHVAAGEVQTTSMGRCGRREDAERSEFRAFSDVAPSPVIGVPERHFGDALWVTRRALLGRVFAWICRLGRVEARV